MTHYKKQPQDPASSVFSDLKTLSRRGMKSNKIGTGVLKSKEIPDNDRSHVRPDLLATQLCRVKYLQVFPMGSITCDFTQ